MARTKQPARKPTRKTGPKIPPSSVQIRRSRQRVVLEAVPRPLTGTAIIARLSTPEVAAILCQYPDILTQVVIDCRAALDRVLKARCADLDAEAIVVSAGERLQAEAHTDERRRHSQLVELLDRGHASLEDGTIFRLLATTCVARKCVPLQGPDGETIEFRWVRGAFRCGDRVLSTVG